MNHKFIDLSKQLWERLIIWKNHEILEENTD